MEKENSDKEEYVMMLQRCVKKLHFGSWEEKEVAAKVIEEGLAKQDVVKVREMTSELGVVRVLVSMAVSEVASRHRVGLKALIHLSNGTHGLPPSMNIWKPKWHSQSPNLKDYSNAVLAELLQIKTDQENHLEKSLEKAANMDIHKF
ncbi:hypothetical protein JHK82_019336 [Glycine max]|nr:hypothetical protein JHK82_019336 [Glycine max]